MCFLRLVIPNTEDRLSFIKSNFITENIGIPPSLPEKEPPLCLRRQSV